MTVSGFRATILIAVGLVVVPFAAAAQQPMPQPASGGGPPQGGGMPDLRAISGKPLPDRGMATGTITVRVARQLPANPVADVEVKALLEAPGGESRMRTAKTDAGGRAMFEALPVGHSFRAEVVVDREKLTTETFTVPALGGVRTMLIAALGKGDAAAGAAGAAGAAEAAGAGAGKQAFALGLVSGTAMPDGALPSGTVEVTALDEAGKPLADKVIELGYVRTGAQVEVMRAQTDSSGMARFTGVGAAPPPGGAKAEGPPLNPSARPR